MNKTLKRILKYLLIVVGVVLILAGAAGLYINISGVPKYDPPKVALTVQPTPERIARGKRLVSMLCADCHLDLKTGALTGHRLFEVPAEFGEIRSRNITKDPVYGIGKWSDGDIARLLRTGLKPDGQYVPPYMVKLPHASDEDLYSIISFLHSDDSLVRPMQVQDTDCKPSFLVKFLCRVAFKPFDYPTQPIATPDINDKVAYGRYIVNSMVQCYACHSADFKTMNPLEPEKSEGYLGGGNQMADLSGKKMFTANLTFDPKNGIGNWTEAQFIRAVREGFKPDNTPLRYPMEPFPELTEQEVSCVYAYLKTVPVITKAVPKSEDYVLAAQNVTAGQRIYYKYACYSCHAETGSGVCDLRQAYQKYPTNDSLIAWIRDPSKIKPGTKMPTWNGVIKEDEYQALCEYVRLLGERGMKVQTASMTK